MQEPVWTDAHAMNPSEDLVILTLLEQAQSLPDEAREPWLARQSASEAVRAQVRRLLQAERRMADFLETDDGLPAELAFPSSGDRLGNYELLHPLAAGGMGVVYLARRADDAYEQQVAIKLIRTIHLHGDERSREALIARFEAERALLARLNHPNIARILDGGRTADGLPWLVMEYVDGVPITDYCEQRRLDIDARLRLLCKVCDAVQEIHGHLIVHRDLKPDNVLVGDNGEPRLIDFGIARALNQPQTPAPAQERGTLLSAMTPAYASPEQVRQQPLTTGSDVYSLGVLLFQLIVGQRPFDLAGLDLDQIEQVVCQAPPPALRQALRGAALADDEKRRRSVRVGADLERIAAKALDKDPQRRYGSAQALADDLRHYLSGMPVQAHPDSALYRARKFVRRHALGVGITVAAALAVLIAAGVAIHQAAIARRAASDMEQTNAFLIDVLNLSDPYQSGAELSLGDAVDQAAELIEERLGHRPELAATLHLTLGDSMRQRGRYAAAEQQLGKALAQSERLFGTDDLRSIEALLTYAALRGDQAHYEDAEPLLHEALARIDRASALGSPLHQRAINQLGVVHLAQNEFEEAERYLSQALAADDSDPDRDSTNRTVTLSNLAVAARGLGDLDRADRLYEEVQAIFEQRFPQGSAQFAILLNNRGRVAYERGDIQRAADLGSQSLAMNRAVYGNDNSLLALPMFNLAFLYNQMQRPDIALPLAEEAFELADRTLEDSHPNRLRALVTLAEALRQAGRSAEADQRLASAEAVIAADPDAGVPVARYLERIRSELCKMPDPVHGCQAKTDLNQAGR